MAVILCTSVRAQFMEPLDFAHPAIAYGSPMGTDRVAALNTRLRRGDVSLRMERGTGYLRSLLAALDIPIDSQIVVFSKTSLQSARISPANPRAIYFSDSAAVAWVPGGFIEVAAHDPRQGGVFYMLPQVESATPQLTRDNGCLQCHYSTGATLGIPGFLSRSIPTAADGTLLPWLGNATPDHRTPLDERWGGWFVTGRGASRTHLGNATVDDRRAQELPASRRGTWLADLSARVGSGALLTAHSDAVALLVFNHQVHLMNLLTRAGWEARIAEHDGAPRGERLRATVFELVDYLVFVDEAPIGGVEGSTGFAASFTARGPRDSRGRSLRDLDLGRHLLRYPCSYLIYSDAFDALPAAAKDAVYRRLWDVLSGQDQGSKYAGLSAASRQAAIEILRDTKPGLPRYFY
jgi:hypothetical protein